MQTSEHEATSINGKLCWQQWTERAIFDEENNLIEFQSVGRDVTDLKRMEEELHVAKKLESVGLLAGGIAHDFNNLLTAILGNTMLNVPLTHIFPWQGLGLWLVFILVLAVLASIIPARSAARLIIRETLTYE